MSMKTIKALLLVLILMVPLINRLDWGFGDKRKSSLVRVLIFLKERKSIPHIIQEAMMSIWGSKTERELDIARKALYSKIFSAYESAFNDLLAELRSLGGTIIYRIASIGAVSACVPADKLDKLRRSDIVRYIIPVFKVRVSMDVAAKAVYAPDFWSLGWNGSEYDDLIKGIEVAIVDTGISETSYISGKIIDAKSFTTGEPTTSDFNGHGTKVAHIVASRDQKYRGIAYGVNLINAKALNRNGEGILDDVMAAIEWALIQAGDTAEIINLSIGAPKNAAAGLIPDGSSIITRLIDQLAYLYDAVAVIAVGNVEGGYGGVNIPADAFNGIATGAMDDKNTVDRSDDSLWSGSCVGPTEDGRIKPDVVAPGVGITTYTVGGALTTGSGTSFATPIVSGAAALIYSYLSNEKPEIGSLALATKAVIILSADFWGDNPPNNRYGFGYLNLRNALQVIDNVVVLNVSSGNRIIYEFDMLSGESFSLGMVWWRVPNNLLSFYKIGVFRVCIIDPNGHVVYDHKESTNNVIKIGFQANVSGTYRLIIEKVYRADGPMLDSVAIVSTKPLRKPRTLNLIMPTLDRISDAQFRNVTLRIKNNAEDVAEDVVLRVKTENMELNKTIFEIDRIGVNEEIEIVLNGCFADEGLVVVDANVSYIIGNKTYVVENVTMFYGYDDDSKPPKIISVNADTTLLGDKIIFKVEAHDEESGVASVKVYWRIDYPIDEYSLDLADGVFNLSYDQRKHIWKAEIKVKSEWNGKTMYYVVEVEDADNDRAGDSLVAYESGKINIRMKIEIIVVIALLVVLSIAYLVFRVVLPRMRRKPK